METLTPDAAVDAFRALTRIASFTQERFAALVRTRYPRRKDLLAFCELTAPDDESISTVVEKVVEGAFLRLLRLKVELDRLPASGALVTIDEIAFVAGLLAVPFIADVVEEAGLKPDAVEIAKRWKRKPGGEIGVPGAFARALAEVFVEIGAPETLAPIVTPVIEAMVMTQPCMRWTSPGRSPAEDLAKTSADVERIKRERGYDIEALLKDESAVDALIRAGTTRETFLRAADVAVFPEVESLLEGAEEKMLRSAQAVAAADPSDEDVLDEMQAITSKTRAVGRSLGMIFAEFMREEADRIWGSEAPSAT